MGRYFLGVDVGNTKTEAVIADESGSAIGYRRTGTASWEKLGWDKARAALQDVVSGALESAELSAAQISGAGFGFAGYDWPEDETGHRANVEAMGLACPTSFGNDTLVALTAGATDGWGVVVVAGTSNNCRGRGPDGREGRVTGMGAAFGEYGGASELVARALQAVSLHWSDRGPATALSEALVSGGGAQDVDDLLAGLARGRYRLGARLAPGVFEVAATGDSVAVELIRWAGRELGSLANGVIRQLSMETLAFDVVLAGSLYKGSELLVETMATRIHDLAPRARLTRLQAPPAIGGVLLGMRQVEMKPDDELRQRLMQTTCSMLEQAPHKPDNDRPR